MEAAPLLMETETACLGTAILAMVGAGEYASVADAVKNTVKIKKTYMPTGQDYQEAYLRFNETEKKLNM